MKHSEHTSKSEDSLNQHELLDLLVNGPSSLAALYGDLRYNFGYSAGLSVQQLIDTLLNMERQGWVKATQMDEDGSFHSPTALERRRDLFAYQGWLPNAKFEGLALDEVGLWYEITSEGFAEWRGWNKKEDDPLNQWLLYDSNDTQTITIIAKTLEVAEENLWWWLSCNESIKLIENSRTVEMVTAFTLRDGSVITNGVKLIYHYRNFDESSQPLSA